MDLADLLAATRAFDAGEEWTWGELPQPTGLYSLSNTHEWRLVDSPPILLPKPADPGALLSEGPLCLLTLKFEPLVLDSMTPSIRLTLELQSIAHSHGAIEEIFSGPVLGFGTPFDSVVALCGEPGSGHGGEVGGEPARGALWELRFPRDLAGFAHRLPQVGFVCGSPLLNPEINAARFFDIEPDQVAQIVGAFTHPLPGQSREKALRALEEDGAWSVELHVGEDSSAK